MRDTFEVTGSTRDQRRWLIERIGVLAVTLEYLGDDTYNITIPHESEELLTDWAEENKLECRLV